MERIELYKLYCMLCDLLECCTAEEREQYRDAICEIKNLLNKKMGN